MKRFKLLASTGLLAAAMVAPSLAADLPRPAYKAPIYSAPGFSWSGFYIGANAGYGFGDSNWTSAAGTTGDFDVNGWTGGATLGYNLQTGVFVFGIEGDINYSEIKGRTSVGICAGTTCETRNTWLGTARGRIGYSFDRFLPYITGGAAFGGIRMTVAGVRETDTQIGWTVGGGLEYAFLGSWSAKLEYLYVDLGSADCSAATCGLATEVEFKSHVVRGGLNYRF